MGTVITNGGLGIVTNRLKGSGTEPVNVAWGTGAGTAGVADTTLFTEAAEDRTVGTSSLVTTNTTNDTYQVEGTITSLSGQTITNAGLFDDVSAGSLFLKGDFSGIALLAGESIAFTMKAVFDQA